MHSRTQGTKKQVHTYLVPNMHIDSKDLVPVSIWEVRTPHMYMGSSRKHMGGVDTPYAYGSSRKHMGAVSILGFTHICMNLGYNVGDVTALILFLT